MAGSPQLDTAATNERGNKRPFATQKEARPRSGRGQRPGPRWSDVPGQDAGTTVPPLPRSPFFTALLGVAEKRPAAVMVGRAKDWLTSRPAPQPDLRITRVSARPFRAARPLSLSLFVTSRAHDHSSWRRRSGDSQSPPRAVRPPLSRRSHLAHAAFRRFSSCFVSADAAAISICRGFIASGNSRIRSMVRRPFVRLAPTTFT